MKWHEIKKNNVHSISYEITAISAFQHEGEYKSELIQETEWFINELKSTDRKSDHEDEKPAKNTVQHKKDCGQPSKEKVTRTSEEGSQIELGIAPGGPPLTDISDEHLHGEACGGEGVTLLAAAAGGNNGTPKTSLPSKGNAVRKSQHENRDILKPSNAKGEDIVVVPNDNAEHALKTTKEKGVSEPVKIDKGLEKLRNENLKLKQAKLCRICRDNDANRMFLPCAHLAACSLCSPAVVNCPQCTGVIRGVVSVYFG